MKILDFICPGVAFTLVVVSAPAMAQVYSWKDPANGQSRFSTIAPPWYNRGGAVSGPRVLATVGERVIDDTALPYEDRLLLSGKSRDYVDKLRLQKHPVAPAAQGSNLESASPSRDRGANPNKTATRGESVSKSGS